MRIDTEIKPVVVEIDDREYEVAAKTVAVATVLARIANDDEKPNFQKWLEQMAVVIGRDVVDELFPDGDNEDLDRMEAIYAGVMAAFDHNGKKLRDQREREERENLHDLASTLSVIADKTHEINSRYPGIARPSES